MPANPHQIHAAETLLGLRTHGHHSHGHPPYPSHDPPRLAHGGWYPPGAGPFRPGPGAPSFGARMPMTHRPGITFGPAHRPRYENRGTGWEGRGVFDLSAPSHTPVGIGSRQRWHSVTHMMSGTPVFAGATLGQRLTPVEKQTLRQMMIDALRPKTDPSSVAAKLFASQTQSASAQTRLKSLFSKQAAPSAKNDLSRLLFGPALAKVDEAAAAQALQAAGFSKPTAYDKIQQLYDNVPRPQGGGGSGSNGVDFDVDVNIPTPTASANLKF